MQAVEDVFADAVGLLLGQFPIGVPGFGDQEQAGRGGDRMPLGHVDVHDLPAGGGEGAVDGGVDRGSASTRSRPTRPTDRPAAVKPGSRSSMPTTTPATSRAIGPTVSKLGDRGHTPSSGMRPQVVFSPAVPQQAAGIRTDPPVSLP